MNRELPRLVRSLKVMTVLSLGCCVASQVQCTTVTPPFGGGAPQWDANSLDGRWVIARDLFLESEPWAGPGPPPRDVYLTIRSGVITSLTFEGDGRRGTLLADAIPATLDGARASIVAENVSQFPIAGEAGGPVSLRFSFWGDRTANALYYRNGIELRIYNDANDGDNLTQEALMARATAQHCCLAGVCIEWGAITEQDCTAEGGEWVLDCIYDPCEADE